LPRHDADADDSDDVTVADILNLFDYLMIFRFSVFVVVVVLLKQCTQHTKDRI